MQLGHHWCQAVPHQDTILVEEGGDRAGDGSLPLTLGSAVHIADRQGVLVVKSVGRRQRGGQGGQDWSAQGMSMGSQ